MRAIAQPFPSPRAHGHDRDQVVDDRPSGRGDGPAQTWCDARADGTVRMEEGCAGRSRDRARATGRCERAPRTPRHGLHVTEIVVYGNCGVRVPWRAGDSIRVTRSSQQAGFQARSLRRGEALSRARRAERLAQARPRHGRRCAVLPSPLRSPACATPALQVHAARRIWRAFDCLVKPKYPRTGAPGPFARAPARRLQTRA